MRGVLREQRGTLGWTPELAERVAVGPRAVSDLDRLPGGGWLVVDHKAGVVSRLDARGGTVSEWPLDGVQAVAVDPFGRAFVAAGTRIYLLVNGADHDVGAQGDMTPVSSIAIDAAGGVWMLDRRGGRVARLDPAGDEPELI